MPAKQRAWAASQLHEIAATAALHKAAAIQRRCGSDGQAVACRRFVFVNAIACVNLVHVALTQGTLVLSWAPRRTTSRARLALPARLRLSGLWAMRRAAAQRSSLRCATMQFAQQECQRPSLRAASPRRSQRQSWSDLPQLPGSTATRRTRSTAGLSARLSVVISA